MWELNFFAQHLNVHPKNNLAVMYTNLNPFNHGTATISYSIMPEEESSPLRKILQDSWGIDEAKIRRLSAGAEKSSNNFRVDAASGIYLLKHSHINEPDKQDLVNRCISYLKEKGIQVPTIIPAQKEETFIVKEGSVFCLYCFVEGENFDGSKEELQNAASEIGRLHKALALIPYTQELKKISGTIVRHDRELLEKVIFAANASGGKTEFDDYALSILDEVNEVSRVIIAAEIEKLPFQIIHYDLHPHNVLFDGNSKELLALLDFDSLLYSQRVRDVSFAMHRFARTCGEKTERKQDTGVDVRERAKSFLERYLAENEITSEEIKLLPLVIQDEAIKRVTNILRNYYLLGDTTWSFDLPKQVTTLREGGYFLF